MKFNINLRNGGRVKCARYVSLYYGLMAAADSAVPGRHQPTEQHGRLRPPALLHHSHTITIRRLHPPALPHRSHTITVSCRLTAQDRTCLSVQSCQLLDMSALPTVGIQDRVQVTINLPSTVQDRADPKLTVQDRNQLYLWPIGHQFCPSLCSHLPPPLQYP